MKILITTLLATFTLCISSTEVSGQQQGTIKYTESIKFEIEGLKGLEGLDLGDMMPSSMSANKDLIFADKVSVYKDGTDNVSEDVKMESDDGSFQMVIEHSNSEEIMFIDLKNKEVVNQTEFMGKEFLITENLSKPKWKITDERIKYLGYVCQKATMVETVEPTHGTDKSDEPKERSIVAWFTSEIPVPVGPMKYNQLPGAILMISIDDGKTEIKATEVTLGEVDREALAKPSKGKKVTSEEYEKIMAEKVKEMEEMYKGKGSTIMIRG